MTNSHAALYTLTDNPEFAKLLYKTLVTAQLTEREVYVQLRPRTSSYLTIDRVMLK